MISAIATWVRKQTLNITNERGANLVEYSLLVALIAIVCIGGALYLGESLIPHFNKAGSSIQQSPS